jgi:V/A-type H+/Na+-transporting ATPase subunit E
MEEKVTVKDLIDTIKKEGIEAANRKAQDIHSEAQHRADELVQGAKKEAEKIIGHAKEEADRLRQMGEKALVQAGRNLLISLRQEIISLFQRLSEREASAALTPEAIKDIVIKIIDKWSVKGECPPIEVLVPEKDLARLEEALMKTLQKEWKKGVTLKPVDHIQSGFQIGERDGSVHYNFTEKGIIEILSAYMNPRLAKFLEGSAKQE